MKKLIKIFIFFLFIGFIGGNVDAMTDATLKNIKVNNKEVECIDYVCNVEIYTNTVVITYETNSPNATVNFASGQSFTMVGNTYTATRIVTSGDKEHVIEYTFNISKHVKSSDYSLKELYLNEEAINLRENNYVYNAMVDFDIEELVIKATPTDVNAKIEVSSTYLFEASESSKAIDFKVVAEDGESKTYRLFVMRNERPDTTLSSLEIKESIIKFSKDTYEYTANVPYTVNTINIDAKATNSEATIEIKKNETLVVGENTITITVTNKRATSIYTIIVNRAVNMDESLANLKDLTIDNVDGLKFNPDVLEYNLELVDIPSTLTIKALPVDSNGRILITGNENVTDGSVIKVQNILNDTGITRTYLINVFHLNSQELSKTLVIILIIMIVIIMIVIFIVDRKNKHKILNTIVSATMINKVEEIEII